MIVSGVIETILSGIKLTLEYADFWLMNSFTQYITTLKYSSYLLQFGLTLILTVCNIPSCASDERLDQMSESELTERGLKRYAVEDFVTAIQYFSEILRRNPKDIDSLSSRGKLWSLSGDRESALADYTAAITILETAKTQDLARLAHLYHRRAYSYEYPKESLKALADVERALYLNPNYGAANFSKGYFLRAQGRKLEAQEWLLGIIARDPTALIPRTNLIAWADDDGDEELGAKACDSWRSVAVASEQEIFGGALNTLSLSNPVPLNPIPGLFYLNCAKLMKSLGEKEKARELLLYAASAPAKGGAAYIARGESQWLLGEREAALSDYTKAVEAAPLDSGALLAQGRALYFLGRYPESKTSLDSALALSPNLYEASAYRAATLGYLGNKDDAIKDAEKAVKGSPSSSFAWESLAWIRSLHNDVGGADEAYGKALALDPSNRRLRATIANYKMRSGRLDEAKALFDTLIEEGHHEGLTSRAWILMEKGDRSGALRDAKEAIAKGYNVEYATQLVRYIEGPFGEFSSLTSRQIIIKGLSTLGEMSIKSHTASTAEHSAQEEGKIGTLLNSIHAHFVFRDRSTLFLCLGIALCYLLVRVNGKKVERGERPSLLRRTLMTLGYLVVSCCFWRFIVEGDSLMHLEQYTTPINTLLVPRGEVKIPLLDPIDLDGLSRAEILEMRTKRLTPFVGEVVSPYRPSYSVFGEIENYRPWWGLHGLYWHGNGSRSIEGPSEESRFLLNPLLLVGISESRAFVSRHTPRESEKYYPYPVSLTRDIQGRFIVYYSVADYLKRLDQLDAGDIGRTLTVTAYNARDFGYDYLVMDASSSENLEIPRLKSPIEIKQFIHRGNSCGYPGGCNNMSPHQAELNIKIIRTPAKLSGHLFRTVPNDPLVAGDASFTIHLE